MRYRENLSDEKRDDLDGIMMSDANNDENYDEDDWEDEAKPWLKFRPFFFIGGIIIVLGVFIFLLAGRGGVNEVTIDRIHNIEMRIAQLEGKISSFTDLTNRISELENKPTPAASGPNTETTRLINSIDKRIERLENDILKLASSVKVSAPSNTGENQAVSAPPQPQTKQADKTVYHTVKSGETLYSIARVYGVSVSSIQKLNKLSGNSINVGQKIIIK